MYYYIYYIAMHWNLNHLSVIHASPKKFTFRHKHKQGNTTSILPCTASSLFIALFTIVSLY